MHLYTYAGQYNNQYSEGPAHNYSISYLPETTESSGEHKYVNFPQSLPYQGKFSQSLL